MLGLRIRAIGLATNSMSPMPSLEAGSTFLLWGYLAGFHA